MFDAASSNPGPGLDPALNTTTVICVVGFTICGSLVMTNLLIAQVRGSAAYFRMLLSSPLL